MIVWNGGQPVASQLPRLSGYLEADPENLTLLADAAMAAFDEGQPEQACTLLDRYAALEPLPAALSNIEALAALGMGDSHKAAVLLERLLADDAGNSTIRFNLACAKSAGGDHQGALDLLHEEALASIPGAAALKIRSMHHLGLVDEALEEGEALVRSGATGEDLMGALAIVAIDASQLELARSYASRSGLHHEGLSATGSILLAENKVEEAVPVFDQALAQQANSPRAQLGKGLALLAAGAYAEAAHHLDEAGRLFADHLGSWIAAGWAYFADGRHDVSRDRFERAVALDRNFAEGHGGLACLDVLSGDVESAQRRMEVALRLDSKCVSALYAKTLLYAREGKTAKAEALTAQVLMTPVEPGGKTLGEAITELARPPQK